MGGAMTRDDVIRMAREAGMSFNQSLEELSTPFCNGVHCEELERFAALVAEREREACAAIAEKELGNTAMLTSIPPKSSAAWNILFAIRARGQT